MKINTYGVFLELQKLYGFNRDKKHIIYHAMKKLEKNKLVESYETENGHKINSLTEKGKDALWEYYKEMLELLEGEFTRAITSSFLKKSTVPIKGFTHILLDCGFPRPLRDRIIINALLEENPNLIIYYRTWTDEPPNLSGFENAKVLQPDFSLKLPSLDLIIARDLQKEIISSPDELVKEWSSILKRGETRDGQVIMFQAPKSYQDPPIDLYDNLPLLSLLVEKMGMKFLRPPINTAITEDIYKKHFDIEENVWNMLDILHPI